jgi:hypothetical protein
MIPRWIAEEVDNHCEHSHATLPFGANLSHGKVSFTGNGRKTSKRLSEPQLTTEFYTNTPPYKGRGQG